MHNTNIFTLNTDDNILYGFVKFNMLGLCSYIYSTSESCQNESINQVIIGYIKLWLNKIISISNNKINTSNIVLQNQENNTIDKFDILIDKANNQIIYLGNNINFDLIEKSIYEETNFNSWNKLYLDDEIEFDPEDSADIDISQDFILNKLADSNKKLLIIKYLIDNANSLINNPCEPIFRKLKHMYVNYLIRKFKYLDLNTKKIGYNLRVSSWNFGPDFYNEKPTYRIRLIDSSGISSGLFEKTIEYIDNNKKEYEHKNYYYMSWTDDNELVENFFYYLMDNVLW